jgi:hypothetical protein
LFAIDGLASCCKKSSGRKVALPALTEAALRDPDRTVRQVATGLLDPIDQEAAEKAWAANFRPFQLDASLFKPEPIAPEAAAQAEGK